MKAPVYSNLRDLGRDHYRGAITCAQYRAARKQLIDQFVEADDTQLMGVPEESVTLLVDVPETRSAAPEPVVNRVILVLFVLALCVLGTIFALFFLVSGT